MSAVALGNPLFATQEFSAADARGQAWSLVGVAPDARLAFYDAQITPAIGPCQDALLGTLAPGDLWIPGEGQGVLEAAYDEHGARVFAPTYGREVNAYGADAQDIDGFLLEHPEAIALIPVGNGGGNPHRGRGKAS